MCPNLIGPYRSNFIEYLRTSISSSIARTYVDLFREIVSTQISPFNSHRSIQHYTRPAL